MPRRHAGQFALPCRLLRLIVPVVFAAAAPAPVHAQAPEIVVGDALLEVRLADGSVVYARVVAVDGDRITLVTSGGVRIEVDRAQVRSARRAEGRVVRGEFWPEDPHATRLFFAPTGRSLRMGEGNFGVYELFLPFLAIGLSDRFTLAGGAPIMIGEFSAVYIAPKLQLVAEPLTQLSVGAFTFIAMEDDPTPGGILYGVATLGTRDNAFTLGGGWGFSGTEIGGDPIFLVGGEARVSRRAKVLTENYFLPSEGVALLSGGLRFIGERLSADVGIGAGTTGGGFECCLPLVNFSYAFGRRSSDG